MGDWGGPLAVGMKNVPTAAPGPPVPPGDIGFFHAVLSVKFTAGGKKPGTAWCILQLFLIHPEIVTQFMDDRKADLFADLCLAGADRFNILLVQNDVIGSLGQSNMLLLVVGAVEDAQKQSRLLPRLL